MSIPDSFIQKSLPDDGVPATGVFIVEDNIEPNSYNTPTDPIVEDSPYNSTLIGDSLDNLVGSSTKPYLPMALPSYIPTLYENVYNIQTNLVNVIPTTDVSDNRQYPNVQSVKSYVALQLSGSEVLNPTDVSGLLTISTGLTTSILYASNNDNGSVNVQKFIDASGNDIFTTTYPVNPIDTSRSGSQKTFICANNLGTDASNTTYLMQIELDPSYNQYFIVNGTQYKYYAFTGQGDILSSYQFKDNSGNEVFFVLSYGGLFSNTPIYNPLN